MSKLVVLGSVNADHVLQVTDFPVALLYMFAIASMGIYGIVLAGWASGSTYPLLGGLRSSAQMISYEIAMGLSFVGVFLFAGTMSTSGIVNGQIDLNLYCIQIPILHWCTLLYIHNLRML